MEKVYVIPLRKAFRSSRTKRASKAIKVVRDFLHQHMKSDNIKLGRSVNESVWARGIQKIPRKIRVHADKDENGVVYVEMLGVEIKFRKEEVKEEKKEAKPEGKKEEKKPGKKPEPKQEEKPEPQEKPEKKTPASKSKTAGKK